MVPSYLNCYLLYSLYCMVSALSLTPSGPSIHPFCFSPCSCIPIPFSSSLPLNLFFPFIMSGIRFFFHTFVPVSICIYFPFVSFSVLFIFVGGVWSLLPMLSCDFVFMYLLLMFLVSFMPFPVPYGSSLFCPCCYSPDLCIPCLGFQPLYYPTCMC